MLSRSLKGQEVMLRWVLFALFLGICADAGKWGQKDTDSPDLSRGWGDSLTWAESYEKALTMMAESQKPMMVIFHKDDSEESQALKKAFAANNLIQAMCKEKFIMLNLVEETTVVDLAPDGHYVPRIIFVDPSKTVRTDVSGKFYNRAHFYEPVDMVHLTENMRIVQTKTKTEL